MIFNNNNNNHSPWGRAVLYSTRSIPPIMGGIQPCHPMIACAPLPPAPSPTTSRTPHSVEHRPRQTVLRQRYNLAQSKHAVAYCWRWRRTYFTLREDRLHEAQTEPNYDNACAYRDANGSLFLCTRTPMPSGRTKRVQELTRPRYQEQAFSSLLKE